MPLFHYKVLNKEQKTVEGQMESKDRFALYHTLKQDGSIVIYVEEIKGKESFSLNKSLPFLGGVKAYDKIIFAKNLSKMIDAGLPMTRALTIMEKEASGEFKKTLASLNKSLSEGATLSNGMKNYPKVFPPLFVSMVKAGEESGNISGALQNIALQMEKNYLLNKRIRGALMYPTVVFSLMIVIGILMMVYMVPTLTATFKGLNVALPISTRIIIGTSDFLVAYFLYVILGAIIFIGLIIFTFRSEKGKRFLDWFVLHVPIIKTIVKHINSARTARTLSSLISSGVDIVVSIDVTKEVIQNSYYKEVLKEAGAVIQKGDPISMVFSKHEKLYPIFVSEMVSVGEETGKIGEMLMSVALFYEDDIDQKTKNISTVIEPFLMIFIGLAVGLFAFAVISPIYSLGDSIQ
jgi:type II secretory pathway component PulF